MIMGASHFLPGDSSGWYREIEGLDISFLDGGCQGGEVWNQGHVLEKIKESFGDCRTSVLEATRL